MSDNNPNSRSTFQSFSTSFSSSSINGQTTSRSETIYSDDSGSKVHRKSQEPGQEPREERFEVDSSGNRIQAGDETRRIEDVSESKDDEQAQRDREYEERMEDEYAKREGGA